VVHAATLSHLQTIRNSRPAPGVPSQALTIPPAVQMARMLFVGYNESPLE